MQSLSNYGIRCRIEGTVSTRGVGEKMAISEVDKILRHTSALNEQQLLLLSKELLARADGIVKAQIEASLKGAESAVERYKATVEVLTRETAKQLKQLEERVACMEHLANLASRTVGPTDQCERSGSDDTAKEQPQRSIMELQGLGKELWAGVDADKFIAEERESWNG
jgi:hypothetical protein